MNMQLKWPQWDPYKVNIITLLFLGIFPLWLMFTFGFWYGLTNIMENLAFHGRQLEVSLYIPLMMLCIILFSYLVTVALCWNNLQRLADFFKGQLVHLVMLICSWAICHYLLWFTSNFEITDFDGIRIGANIYYLIIFVVLELVLLLVDFIIYRARPGHQFNRTGRIYFYLVIVQFSMILAPLIAYSLVSSLW